MALLAAKFTWEDTRVVARLGNGRFGSNRSLRSLVTVIVIVVVIVIGTVFGTGAV